MPAPQSAPLNFAHGLDTKTDPNQVMFGKFLRLANTVFTTLMRLTKRNGYGALTSLPNTTSSYLTTFSDNLTAIGSSIEAYSSGSKGWISKGNIQPIFLSVLPTGRSALNQTQCDSVVASNGYICTVYTESNNGVFDYKYVIADSATGQNIVAPSLIPVGSGTVTGSPRVFLLGGYFVIVFTNVITSTSHLQYVAISINSPTTVTANADIAATYVAKTTLSWDGVVVNNQLYIAYNNTSGGQSIKITYLTTGFSVAAPATFAASICTIMSMCADLTNPTQPTIYASFYDLAGTTGNIVAVDQNLNKKMTATSIISSGTILNMTCSAQNGVATVVYEVNNNYSYDSSIPTHFLDKVQVTLPATVTTGTVGSTTTFIRSVGLASKAFIFNGLMYQLCVYQSPLQNTYFLIDINGNVISRFAYENGGGYLTTGLPQAQLIDTTVNIAYLFKDLVQSTNTLGLVQSIGPAGASNIYAQTGVNCAFIDFSSSTLSTSEIGQNLNISGGMLWSYDGQTLSEQGFHLFPDSVEVSAVADPGPTGTLSNVTNPTIITSMSSVAGIAVGMTVTDVTNAGAIPANTTVVAVGTTTITMSNAALAAHSGDTLLFVGGVAAQQYYYQVTYEWMDAAGDINRSAPSVPVTVTPTANHTSVLINIPYLRLTYKTNVKIVIYRWSTANQVYYQITSITAPTLNTTTSDSLAYQDILADSAIIGNSIIYTTGGVLENIPGPAFTATTLFDDRLWGIDAEDPNLLWNSKQVIEATPVEMSDLLTTYVAPSTGAQGSTGDLKCLFPMDDKIVLWKTDAIYYITGTGPDNTGSNSQYSQPIFVTGNVGCANQRSIVLMPQGLMFQSDKGIWLLGRDLSTSYIGSGVEEFNSFMVNSAVSVPGTTQVRFTLSSGVTLMYDYFVGEWGTFEGCPAVSSTLYQGLHTYINASAQVAQETPGQYLDLGNPVLMSFTTSWLNLTGLQGYQRAYFFFLLGKYITPHKLSVGIAYDYNPSFVTQPLITPTNFSPAYGDPGPYGQGNPYGGESDLENWRVFLKKQHCQAFQITVQELYDPTMGIAAGAGLTLSGINLIYMSKKSYRPISAAHSVG